MTEVYILFVTILACAVWMRKRDMLASVLCLALAASLTMTFTADGWRVLAYAAAIDAFVCLAALALWTRFHSMRAWSVGLISVIKAGFTLTQYLVEPNFIGWFYALALNAAFVAQLTAAGGFIDGMGIRADNLFHELFPRRHGLLRDGKG